MGRGVVFELALQSAFGFGFFMSNSCQKAPCVLQYTSIMSKRGVLRPVETEVTKVFSFLAVEISNVVAAIRIALAAVILICTGFIIFVVMKQSGNSDGTEAFTGTSNRDDAESYYGRNAGSRLEARLKLWTYICAGVLAVCCIALIIMAAVIA